MRIDAVKVEKVLKYNKEGFGEEMARLIGFNPVFSWFADWWISQETWELIGETMGWYREKESKK